MRRLVLLLLPLLLAPGLSFASGLGVLVRLDAGDQVLESPIKAVLTLDAERHEIRLSDDGVGADGAAGDGMWAGSGFCDSNSFGITLITPAGTYEGGLVEWPPSQPTRDIILRLEDGGLVVSTNAIGNRDQRVSQGASADPPETTAVGKPTATRAATGTESLSPLGFIAAGLAMLSWMGIVLWRGRSGTPPQEPDDRAPAVEVVPEASLAGPGSPSLSDGLMVWRVSEKSLDRSFSIALRSLARFHQVVLVAPSRIQVPKVEGGPVHICPSRRPAIIHAQMAELARRPGRPPALLIVGQSADADGFRDLADAVPLEHGGIALVHKTSARELPVLRQAPHLGPEPSADDHDLADGLSLNEVMPILALRGPVLVAAPASVEVPSVPGHRVSRTRTVQVTRVVDATRSVVESAGERVHLVVVGHAELADRLRERVPDHVTVIRSRR